MTLGEAEEVQGNAYKLARRIGGSSPDRVRAERVVGDLDNAVWEIRRWLWHEFGGVEELRKLPKNKEIGYWSSVAVDKLRKLMEEVEKGA